MLSILLNAIKIAFLLGFLIFIHESGHFLIAKLFKVKVKEFAIGFGPIIWEKQGKETKYVLRIIPLGGFVNLLGEEEASEEEGSYSRASRWKKILILLAGGSVNIIFGLIVYFVLATGSGNFISTTIDKTIENSPAQSASLQFGDKIISANGKKIRLKSDLDSIVSTGEKLTLEIKRGNEIININIIPEKDDKTNIYFLGILFQVAENSLKSNLYYGYWDTVEFTKSVLIGIKELFSGNVGIDQFTGPVGISEVVVQTSNIEQFVYILAVISLSLGVTNLMPFPPLDGGKVLLLLIEAVIRKPIKENINNAIQTAGFILIMVLAVVVTYNDVLRIF